MIIRDYDPFNPYRHGSEAEADDLPGGFVRFSEALGPFVLTAACAMHLRADCESPIEIMLGSQLMAMLDDQYVLVPQYVIRRYRFDFAVFCGGKHLRPRLLIECDGREWHSTPEQKENDAKKTELCVELGIPLLRFTGREIYRNQRFCAEQCLICLDRGEAFDA